MKPRVNNAMCTFMVATSAFAAVVLAGLSALAFHTHRPLLGVMEIAVCLFNIKNSHDLNELKKQFNK